MAMIHGTPMIIHVAAQWRDWVIQKTVVAEHPEKYGSLGLRTIPDIIGGLGPLGGLGTALRDCAEEWLILAACDAIMLDADLPRKLCEQISSEVQVVAMKGDQWETMPALYRRSLLPLVDDLLSRRQLALWKLIEQVPHAAVCYSSGQPPITQINTQEEWRQFCSEGNPPIITKP